jgi:hypothetical protein
VRQEPPLAADPNEHDHAQLAVDGEESSAMVCLNSQTVCSLLSGA